MKYLNTPIIQNCSNVEEFILPPNLIEITDSLFYNCPKITHIDLPEKITYIANAFRNTNITEITIPSSVTKMGTYTFQNCSNLTTI